MISLYKHITQYTNKRLDSIINVKSILYILLFVVLHIIFKLWSLSGESIWADEGFSMFYAQQPLANIIDISIHDQNPPLFMLLLHYWFKLFGISVFAAKALPVIFSVITAVLLFLFSERVFNKKTAILASFFFLLSSTQLYYAHEIRAFTLVELFCIGSFWLYYEILHKPKVTKVIAFAIISVLMLFSHYLSVFVIISQFICTFLFLKKNKKGFWYQQSGFILTGLLFIPWLSVVIKNMPEKGEYWLKSPNLSELFYALRNLADERISLFIYLIIIVAAFIIILSKKTNVLFEEGFNVRLLFVVFSWFLIPIATDYLVAQYTPVFLTRYILYTALGLFLTIAYLLTSLKLNILVKSILMVSLLVFQFNKLNIKPDKPEDWNIIVPKIKSLQDETTITIISSWYQHRCFAYYYSKDYFADYDNILSMLGNDNILAMNDPSSLKYQTLISFKKIIFVQSHHQLVDPDNTIGKYIENNHFNVLKEFNVKGVKTTVYYNDLLQNPDSAIKIQKTIKRSHCELWDFNEITNQITHDNSQIYFCDMEIDSICQGYNKLSRQYSKSGHLSNKVDKNNEYGITFEKNVKELTGLSSINLSLQILSPLSVNTGAKLCFSIQNSYKTYFWKEFGFAETVKNTNKWFLFKASVTLPIKLPEGYKLKVFVWNPNADPVYIDDLEVTIEP